MNKNYFLVGTLTGILFANVTSYLIAGSNFYDFFSNDSKYAGAPPIVIGVFSAIIAGVYFDRMKPATGFLKTALILPAIIFFLGAVIGCLVNFVLNGQLQDFFSWFVKPMYWLVIIGLPLSLFFGSAYFFLSKKLRRS